VTLGRLILAWAPVSVWFVTIGWVTRRLTTGTFSTLRVYLLRAAGRSLVEGALLTLFASLWFDSLGAGGWWLLFALVGALVGLAGWGASLSSLPRPRQTAALLYLLDLTRYVGAGALFAWRLGS
jgi:hypothetical protein